MTSDRHPWPNLSCCKTAVRGCAAGGWSGGHVPQHIVQKPAVLDVGDLVLGIDAEGGWKLSAEIGRSNRISPVDGLMGS